MFKILDYINIKEINSNISVNTFETKYLKKEPVLIKDGCSKWKSTALWSPDYFASTYPDKLVNIYKFELKNQIRSRKLINNIRMFDFVKLMKNNSQSKAYYLLRQSIPDHYPYLESDIIVPPWGKNKKYMSTNLWFGGENNITPLHFDAVDNFLAQIHGTKKIFLYNPGDSRYLYPTTMKSGGRLNFSQVNFQQNISQFPLFKQATVYSLTLEPGQILYIPPGWWHEVHTLSTSISVNFWFNPTSENGALWHILGCQACRLNNIIPDLHDSTLLYKCDYNNILDIINNIFRRKYIWISSALAGVLLENIIKEILGLAESFNIYKDLQYELLLKINSQLLFTEFNKISQALESAYCEENEKYPHFNSMKLLEYVFSMINIDK